MKKLLNYGHPGFYLYVFGIIILFFGIWLPDAPFWLNFEKYSDKLFNRWFTFSQIAIALGIVSFIVGLAWVHSSEKCSK